MRKEFLALVSMFVLLLNDPMVAQAYMMVPTDDAGWEQSGTAWIDPFLGVNDDAVHLVYELNGGVNHNANPDVITAEELPFALEIPVRDGYNFAGWYTDSSYDHKITEITEENAANMVLFAKWTGRSTTATTSRCIPIRPRACKPQSKRIKRVQLCVSG